MTREEAERQARASEQADASKTSTPHRQSSFPISRRSTDRVIQMAEKQAEKTEKQGANEDPRRDRTLTSRRSPSAERTGGAAGATLPVVEEAGEACSREASVLDEKPTRSPKPSSMEQHKVSTPSGIDGDVVRPLPPTNLPCLPQFNRFSMGLGSGTPQNPNSEVRTEP